MQQLSILYMLATNRQWLLQQREGLDDYLWTTSADLENILIEAEEMSNEFKNRQYFCFW